MASQSNRFSSFSMGNAREASSQPHPANAFPTSNWKPNGIWANHLSPSLGNGETQTGLGGSDESFTTNHQAANAFSAKSDSADMWAHSARPWNNADNTTRRASGSPSPARVRDIQPAMHDLTSSNTPSYLSGISRSKPSGPQDSSNSQFKYASSLRDNIAESDKDLGGTTSYPPFNFDSETASARARLAQDPTSSFSAASTGVSVSGTALPAAVPASAPNAAASNAATSLGSLRGHSHRPSLQGPVSFPAQAASANILPYQRNSQPESASSRTFIADRLRQMSLEGQPETSSGSGLGGFAGGLSSYSASSAPFQLNPGSQSWDAVEPVSLAALAGARGSIGSINRGATPVGGSYRQGNSPRSISIPTHATASSWSRPSSRDPRTATYHDPNINAASGLPQRPLPPAFFQEQQQHLVSAHGPVAAGAFVGNQNFFSANPSHYSMYSSYRTPLQMPPLGIGMPLAAPFLQPSPAQIYDDRDPARAFRSPLLDGFRTSRTNRRYELKDIYDHIVEFSGDQHGSRFIQSKLETANSDEKEHVFREISANAIVLMKDVFGNYVVQKFFEHGNQVQKKYLAEQMRGKMVDLSIQTYACRVVQKALQHILLDQQIVLAQELEADIMRVIKDQNGNHVVQKVIELVPGEYIGFIMNSFRGRVMELSSHDFGCRVVQRLLEHGSAEDRASILSELHPNTQDLIMDQYGNYVAQHVIEFGAPSDREQMIAKVLDQLLAMSKHKFASNVVEKCIEFGSEADRRRIRMELNRLGHDGVPVLQQMIKDQYANYVIQKLLKQLKDEELRLFVEAMSTQLGILRRTIPGRQNAAVDRLATAIEELQKAKADQASPKTEKSNAESGRSTSSQQGDRDSIPSLTTAPNTPESSSPPSVSTGPTRVLPDAKAKDSTTDTRNMTPVADA